MRADAPEGLRPDRIGGEPIPVKDNGSTTERWAWVGATIAGVAAGVRGSVLRSRCHRYGAARGGLCRPHPARRKVGRIAGPGSGQVRNDRQSQNREGAWPDRAAGPAGNRRRGDRMTTTEARADGPTTILASIAEKTGWRQISGPLFRKYVGLFLAVVCIALLSNGLFEIFFSYREHTESLIR